MHGQTPNMCNSFGVQQPNIGMPYFPLAQLGSFHGPQGSEQHVQQAHLATGGIPSAQQAPLLGQPTLGTHSQLPGGNVFIPGTYAYSVPSTVPS